MCAAHPLEALTCLYEGRLADLPQRRQMDLGEPETVVGVYMGFALGLMRRTSEDFLENLKILVDKAPVPW